MNSSVMREGYIPEKDNSLRRLVIGGEVVVLPWRGINSFILPEGQPSCPVTRLKYNDMTPDEIRAEIVAEFMAKRRSRLPKADRYAQRTNC